MLERRTVCWALLSLVGLCCALPGCGSKAPEAPNAPAAKAVAGAQEKRADAKGAVDGAAVNAVPQSPMIIYTATLDVIVKDLDAATPDVDRLVALHKGFVGKSEVKGDAGSRRTATYTIRVPVAGFPALRDGVLALGSPERNVVDTQDVTEEFVDVEARIKNLKEQEDKLNELLKEKRKEEKLEDVIKVSDRVFLVRGDIERAQGRRNFLQNRVQLSTINVTIREVKDYKPPTAPTFGNRVGDTFSGSWEALLDFGKGLVLLVVALVPWAPLWVPALVAVWWVYRRVARAVCDARQEREAREAARESEVRARRARRDAEPLGPPDGANPGQ